jgi:DNA-binding CsgD family transcriptional regulator
MPKKSKLESEIENIKKMLGEGKSNGEIADFIKLVNLI